MAKTKFCPTCETHKHRHRVVELLLKAAAELQKRAIEHDASKLEEPEKSIFDENTAALSGMTYGSPEYHETRAKMKPATDHHYANNRHHPEHFEDGLNDMNLIDWLELSMDWKAASERHNDGNILRSINENIERFGISPQMVRVMKNTFQFFSLME